MCGPRFQRSHSSVPLVSTRNTEWNGFNTSSSLRFSKVIRSTNYSFIEYIWNEDCRQGVILARQLDRGLLFRSFQSSFWNKPVIIDKSKYVYTQHNTWYLVGTTRMLTSWTQGREVVNSVFKANTLGGQSQKRAYPTTEGWWSTFPEIWARRIWQQTDGGMR